MKCGPFRDYALRIHELCSLSAHVYCACPDFQKKCEDIGTVMCWMFRFVFRREGFGMERK